MMNCCITPAEVAGRKQQQKKESSSYNYEMDATNNVCEEVERCASFY